MNDHSQPVLYMDTVFTTRHGFRRDKRHGALQKSPYSNICCIQNVGAEVQIQNIVVLQRYQNSNFA